MSENQESKIYSFLQMDEAGYNVICNLLDLARVHGTRQNAGDALGIIQGLEANHKEIDRQLSEAVAKAKDESDDNIGGKGKKSKKSKDTKEK